MSQPYFRTRRWFAAGALWLTAISFSAVAQEPEATTDAALAALDARVQSFSANVYATLRRVDRPDRIGSMAALVQAVDALQAKQQPARAVALILHNLPMVEQQIDAGGVPHLIDILLSANEWKTASQLRDKLKAGGDKVTQSSTSLRFAKYHFARRQWAQTLAATESIGSEVAAEDFSHARLLQGLALQRLRRHRPALAQYAKIPKHSRYYTAARINMALANIRQDWWTDAHLIIEELLRNRRANDEAALTDRLYTTLGYSLLHQQYYRNARETFRNVSLHGPYTNRALLGIALSAAYQDDYAGALNAVRRLKEQDVGDLPVDEANLLMAYFYEKLSQPETAMAGYNQAIQHFDTRIAGIEQVLAVDQADLRRAIASRGPAGIAVAGELLDVEAKLPPAFFDNLRLLASYETEVRRLGDPALARGYAAIDKEHNDTLAKAVRQVLIEKISYLNHYKSQARFGLAAVQDQTSVKQ